MSLTKFNPRVGAETIKTVDTIDDVKNSKDFSNPKLVLGGEILGDGDGGVYHWDSSSTRFADNVNVIKSAHKTMGRWLISSDTRLTGLIDIMGRIDTRVRALEAGPAAPSYALSLIPDATSKEEGTSVTVRLTTTNGEYGTTLKYVVVGDIEEANEGTFDILEVEQDLIFTISNDNILESGETITVDILDGLGSITHASITINVIDDSTYSLYKGPLDPVARNQSFNVRLDVTEVPDGDYPFTLTTTNGLNITPSTGVFTVAGGVGNSVEFSVPDIIIPAEATVTISLDGLNVSQTYDAGEAALESPESMQLTITADNYDTSQGERDPFVIADCRDVIINWGDGSPEVTITSTQAEVQHIYPSANADYRIWIKQRDLADTCDFRFVDFRYSYGSKPVITEIHEWGTIKRTTMEYFLKSATSLHTCPPIPTTFDTSTCANFTQAFFSCRSLNVPASVFANLDTGAADNYGLSQTFANCELISGEFPSLPIGPSLNGPSGTWAGCSSITSMAYMDFSRCGYFAGAWNGCASLQTLPNQMIVDISNGNEFSLGMNGLSLSSTWSGCAAIEDGTFDNFTMPGGYTGSFINSWRGPTSLNSTWAGCSSLTYFPQIDTSEINRLDTTWYGCTNLISFPSIDVGKCNNFYRAWERCTNLTDFSPFSNTTYTSALWENTWSGTQISVTAANNPFTNLGATENIPVGSTAATTFGGDNWAWMDKFTNVFPSSATYLPRFSIGSQTNIIIPIEDPASATLTDGIDIVGWENTNFKGNNNAIPTIPVSSGLNIHMPTLTRTDYDYITQKLYEGSQNASKDYQWRDLLVGDDKLQGDFGLSPWSTSPGYRNALVSMLNWELTDGNSYTPPAPPPQYIYGPHYNIPAAGGTYTIDLSQWEGDGTPDARYMDIPTVWDGFSVRDVHGQSIWNVEGTSSATYMRLNTEDPRGPAYATLSANLTIEVDWTNARTGTLNGVAGTKYFAMALRRLHNDTGTSYEEMPYIWFVQGPSAGWVKTTYN